MGRFEATARPVGHQQEVNANRQGLEPAVGVHRGAQNSMEEITARDVRSEVDFQCGCAYIRHHRWPATQCATERCPIHLD